MNSKSSSTSLFILFEECLTAAIWTSRAFSHKVVSWNPSNPSLNRFNSGTRLNIVKVYYVFAHLVFNAAFQSLLQPMASGPPNTNAHATEAVLTKSANLDVQEITQGAQTFRSISPFSQGLLLDGLNARDRSGKQLPLWDWCLWEIAGTILSLVVMVAIVVILLTYDGQQLPNLPYSITSNAMMSMSLLSTIAKVRS